MVEAINRAQALYCDADGFVHPITNWYDADGDECGPDDAVFCMAGTEGRWYSIDLTEFEQTKLS